MFFYRIKKCDLYITKEQKIKQKKKLEKSASYIQLIVEFFSAQ